MDFVVSRLDPGEDLREERSQEFVFLEIVTSWVLS